jgi:hypothetical protein
VSKSGYDISPASKMVQVYYAPWNENTSSIKAKFLVTETEEDGVEATFTMLHAFIQGGGLTIQPGTIQLGDWIDLEAGLAVEAYGTGDYTGEFNAENADVTPTKLPFTGYEGKTLRLIVVGINSFHSGKGNDEQYTITDNDNTPHVVFQFQNIPVKRQNNTNGGGYAASEMREYLVEVDDKGGNFLAGLKAAGVPEDVLWAPVRYVSSGTNGAGAAQLTDKLWLPTEREMFQGSKNSANGETAANQAWLEYYIDGSKRQKYFDGEFMSYWLGSAFSVGPTWLCIVDSSGNTDTNSAIGVSGVAPAFCVY